MKKFILPILLLFIAASCSPRIIENVRTEVEYRDRYVRDSLFLRDSVYIKEYIKGDSVYINKEVERLRYRDRYIHDTTFVAHHDTMTIEKPVPAKLTRVQQAKLDSYGFLFFLAFALLVWTFRKPLIALIKRFI